MKDLKKKTEQEILKEEQKEEAVKRLKCMGVMKDVINEFNDNDIVMISDRGGVANSLVGVLYYLPSEYKSIIEEFEKNYNSLVYHVTHEHTEFGELLDIFYVSDNKDEWLRDKDDLICNQALVYTENITDKWGSEFGFISYENACGGIIRTE